MLGDTQVMVIDDEREARELISTLLQRIGIQPILVKNGSAALALLEEGLKPSLIILDLIMPEMDGLEVLSRIRSMPQLNSVPVLILSAKAEPESIRMGLNGGADAYVTKTYLTHNLIDRVRVLIAAGRQVLPETRFYGRTALLTPTPPEPTPSTNDPGHSQAPEQDSSPEPPEATDTPPV